jgi:hypothetical protein
MLGTEPQTNTHPAGGSLPSPAVSGGGHAGFQSGQRPDIGTGDIPAGTDGTALTEGTSAPESPVNDPARYSPPPGIDIDGLTEAGPGEALKALSKADPGILACLSVFLLLRKVTLEKDNARLAAMNKSLVISNVQATRDRLKYARETAAYAAGNRMLLGILSSGPAGSGPPGLEMANEIDRLKDTLGKPRRDSRTSSSKPSADDPGTRGRMRKTRTAGTKAKGRPGPKRGTGRTTARPWTRAMPSSRRSTASTIPSARIAAAG